MAAGIDTEDAGVPSPDEERVKTNKTLTRRKFVITLSAGLAIAGYYVLRNKDPLIYKPRSGLTSRPSCPRLRDGLVLEADGDICAVRLISGGDVMCGVNRVGHSVLRRMDGKNTVEDITTILSREFGIPENEALRANVAFFAAQIGIMGLLQEQFRTTIFERADS